jgi:hypothetical protein
MKKISPLLNRWLLRFRWWIAAPVLRPILGETKDYIHNLRRSARNSTSRDWKIGCIEKADGLDATVIQIEQAFGCTSFNEKFHYVRHYD